MKKERVRTRYRKKIENEMREFLLYDTQSCHYKMIVIPLMDRLYHACSFPKEKNSEWVSYFSFTIYQYLFILAGDRFFKGVPESRLIYSASAFFSEHFAAQFERSYFSSKNKSKRDVEVSWMYGSKQPLGFSGGDRALYFTANNYMVVENDSTWRIN